MFETFSDSWLRDIGIQRSLSLNLRLSLVSFIFESIDDPHISISVITGYHPASSYIHNTFSYVPVFQCYQIVITVTCCCSYNQSRPDMIHPDLYVYFQDG